MAHCFLYLTVTSPLSYSLYLMLDFKPKLQVFLPLLSKLKYLLGY